MSQVRRVALSFAGSAAIVTLVALLVPRAFLVNDDPGIVMTLRLGAYTSSTWLSPLLNRLLVALYDVAPAVPWYGLYCYGVIIATGTVVIHTCLELVERTEGDGRVAARIGAILLAASHVILSIAVTWTAVSIAAQGTATVAFVAHLLTARGERRPASWSRGLVYGALFAVGFALREQAIIATAAALVPFVALVGLQFLRARHLPRVVAVIAFGAPFALILGVQNRLPKPRAADPVYEAFNAQRGRISDAAAFADLDKRAPELLARAGWSLEDYRDFGGWRLADDTQFTPEKVKRLADTGGVPVAITRADALRVLRGIATESAATVWLFFSMVAGGCLLAWLCLVDRRRSLLISLGTLAALTLLPIAISVISRFPQRVSLQFYAVAAFGLFVLLAHELAIHTSRSTAERHGGVAVLVISLFMLMWARNVIGWTARQPWPHHRALRQFAERVAARHALVMGGIGAGELDPLLADPVGYEALPSGWGTFTYPWFEYAGRFGIRSGSELLRKMVDNPDAYVVAGPYGHEDFEDWCRRRLGNPAIRLALVDAAWGMPAMLRPELYRLVTTPLARGSEEWQLIARNYALDLTARSAIDLSGRRLRPVTFTAPYEKHLSAVISPARTASLSAIDNGIRCVVADSEPCASGAADREHVGVHIPLNGLGAARLELALFDPENILGVYVYAFAGNRSIRWRWERDAVARMFGFDGTLTLVPGHSAYPLELVEATADSREIRGMDVIVAVVPGKHAGFELRNVEISEP